MPFTMLMQDGTTALYTACKEGHSRVVELLLQHNADITLSREVMPTKCDIIHIIYTYL